MILDITITTKRLMFGHILNLKDEDRWNINYVLKHFRLQNVIEYII